MRTIIAVVLGLSLVACVDAGESAADAYREAQKAFAAKDYKRAYELLTQAFREKPDDPEINFALGRAAFECGDYESAAMAFERMLIMNPNLPRVKLELGRCYYHLKAYDQARKHFEEVLASKPPENVRQNIQT
ncbi:MAG: tetratricopeptide repeat protein, partial [Planctomycetota bacterium]|nr:tetratricopeptide repeat protein [Planctomycetota bacterium]